MTITGLIGKGGKFALDRLVWALGIIGANPNVLTLIGLLINLAAAGLLAAGRFLAAGLIILGASVFDMLDGRVARLRKSATKFGAFFDSVIDRFSDLALFMGLILYYARIARLSYVALTCLALIGSVMISYTRARAESLIGQCKVGFLERPERIALLIIGALFNRMEAVLWVIAVLSWWTVVSRIYYTWEQTKETGRLKG